MDIKNVTSKVEAILFASGEPVPAARIAEVLEITQKDLVKIIDGLNETYTQHNSALTVLKLENNYQLVTHTCHAEIIRTALDMRRMQPLSQAAMEVLAVIAYNQPVTKSFVEQVRGVDSSGVMSNLVEKGLIEEAGRLDLPGKPIAYKTTDLFLASFGLTSLDFLPPLPKEADEDISKIISTAEAMAVEVETKENLQIEGFFED